MIPAASSKLIEPLILVTLSGEKSLFLEVRGPTLYGGGGGEGERETETGREKHYIKLIIEICPYFVVTLNLY